MKTEYKYKDVHHCDAVVMSCLDFRFWRETLEFVEKKLGLKHFDFPSLPGAAKAINDSESDDDFAMQCITVPCDLHKVKKIVLINHEDCGAYGGSKNFESKDAEQKFHEGELRRAKEKLMKKYPDVEYILVYGRLGDSKEHIEFITIPN